MMVQAQRWIIAEAYYISPPCVCPPRPGPSAFPALQQMLTIPMHLTYVLQHYYGTPIIHDICHTSACFRTWGTASSFRSLPSGSMPTHSILEVKDVSQIAALIFALSTVPTHQEDLMSIVSSGAMFMHRQNAGKAQKLLSSSSCISLDAHLANLPGC